MSGPVLAAGTWRTNGELLADVARLYIDLDHDRVLDPTWGQGNWWTVVEPTHFIRHDLHTLDGVDFTDLPEATSSVDVVAFDPPYVPPGGRSTSTVDYYTGSRYGMATTPATPPELRELIAQGLAEMHRVLRAGGRLLVKCQDYINGNQLQPGTKWVIDDTLALGGFRYEDRFEFIAGTRPQPPGRRQLHARRNLSTLLVFTRTRDAEIPGQEALL